MLAGRANLVRYQGPFPDDRGTDVTAQVAGVVLEGDHIVTQRPGGLDRTGGGGQPASGGLGGDTRRPCGRVANGAGPPAVRIGPERAIDGVEGHQERAEIEVADSDDNRRPWGSGLVIERAGRNALLQANR